MATSTISKYNDILAYNLLPNGVDTREANGIYTPNAILQNSLISSYDPANPECYTGTGTTITDLRGVNSLTINGGMEATYDQIGFFDNDGVNDEAVGSNVNLPTGDFSIGGWVYVSDLTALSNTFLFGYFDTFTTPYFLIRYNGGSAQAFELIMRWGSSGTPATIRANGVTVLADRWYYIVGTWNNTTKNGRILVYDSALLRDRTLSRTQIDRSTLESPRPFLAGDVPWIAPSGVGEWHSYSVELDTSQIERNWNNTKARYGY